MGVGSMGELKEWRSDHPNNYFAPRFQVHMWFDHIEHTIIDDVLEWVKDNEDVYADVKMVNRAMAVRKYLYRQAWIFNIVWFVGYFIIMIMLRGQAQPQMPDMIWQG